MAKIESNQIVSDKLLEGFRTEIKLTEEQLKSFDEELLKSLEIQSKLASNVKTSNKGLKEMSEIERKTKATLTEKQKIERQIQKTQEKNTTITKLQRQRLAELRVEEQRRNKIAREAAKATNANLTAMEKLNIKIKTLSNQYKNLLIQEGKETRETRLLRKQILELNKVRDRANKNLGQHTADVGKYQKALRGVVGMLGQLGLAVGVFQIIRNAFGVIRDFDQATADLASILGVSVDQMERLTAQAKELGATTIFTASQVSELQKEYAKLGFTQEEIEGVTEATLQLAAATNSELGVSATVVGSTLRAFGLDVSETQRVVDVMAKSFSATSLDMEKFTVAMRAVAPVAKNAGFSIEETTALLGSITDAGVDASTAGTGLRNVFLELAKTGKTFDEAMAEIANSTDKNATSLELFGKRGAVIGTILAETGEKADQLTETLENSGGAAEEMADKQLDTLGGAVKLLTSAWEGFILKMNEGSGIGETLKNVLKFLANNLELILKIVLGGLKAWALQTLAVKLFRFEINAAGKSVAAGLIPRLIAMGKGLVASARGFKLASFSIKGFAASLKGIPFVGIISALTTVVSLIWASSEASDAATESNSALDQTIKEINKSYLEERAELAGVFEALKNTTAGTLERQEALDLVNEKYGLTLENLSDETAFVEQLNVAYLDLLATMEKRIKTEIVKERLTDLLKEKIQLEEMLKISEEQAALFEGGPSDFNLQGDFNLNQAEENAKSFQKRIEQINALIKDLGEDVSVSDLLGGDTTTGGGSGGSGGGDDEEKRKLKELQELRRVQALERKELESDLIRLGDDKQTREIALSEQRIEQYREEAKFIEELNFKTNDQAIKLRNDYLKFLEDTGKIQVKIEEKTAKEVADVRIEALKEVFKEMAEQAKKQEQLQQQLIKSIRDTLADGANTVATFLQNNLSLLDRQIAAQERLYNESKDRENELKAIAKEKKLDATESINAEREAQKAALKQQQDLERKRLQVEALIATLQAFAAQSQSGQGNPVQNIKNQVTTLKAFVEGNFYEGTDTTIADALGYKGGKDSHIIAIDNNEAVLNPGQTRALGIGKGGNTTDDIVNMYKNSFKQNAPNLNGSNAAKVGDKTLHKKIDKLINATENIVDPNGLAFNAMTKTLNYRNRKKGKNHIYPVSKR